MKTTLTFGVHFEKKITFTTQVYFGIDHFLIIKPII